MRQTVAKLNLPQCTQEVVMLVSVSFLMGQSASSSASLLKFQLSSWFQESESLSPTRFWFSSRPSSLMNPLLGAPSITIARASAITEGLSSAAYRILCTAFTTCFKQIFAVNLHITPTEHNMAKMHKRILTTWEDPLCTAFTTYFQTNLRSQAPQYPHYPTWPKCTTGC